MVQGAEGRNRYRLLNRENAGSILDIAAEIAFFLPKLLKCVEKPYQSCQNAVHNMF